MSLEREIRQHYLLNYPADAARVLEKSPGGLTELADLPNDSLYPLFEHLDPFRLRTAFLSLNLKKQTKVLRSISVRTTLQLLGAMEPEECEMLFSRLPIDLTEELRQLQSFPPGSAGSYMDRIKDFFRTDQTVGEALEMLRKSQAKSLRSLHIRNPDGRLAGRVDVQDMALSDADTPIADLLQPVTAMTGADADENELVKQFELYRVDSIPVVDDDMRLLGVVRYANLFKATEEVATASIQRMVGVSAEERALSSVRFVVRRRLVWLHINLLTAFAAASVVGIFESTIAQFTALAILLPVVAGQSGNAGAQALAVTMRGLSLKEIATMQWPRVCYKELLVGMINGGALAITCGLGVMVWSQSPGLALVIGISMVVAVAMACVAGALVPIVLMRLGQDPATASSIILTTVTDIAGFLSFLGTATLLIGML